MTLCLLKLFSYHEDHICHLGGRNLITLDSSHKGLRQSIPTNSAHSTLGSSSFVKWGLFSSLVHFFVFISNRFISKKALGGSC